MAEPSLAPDYLLRAVRTFLAAVAEGEAGDGGPPAAAPAAEAAAGGDEGEAALGWEEAGCLVWDAAALPDDAAFLVQHGVPAMLLPLLSAACAGELWRELEIGLGILGNLACQPAPKRQLLGQEALPALLLDRLLWVDDAASLGELCRCLAGLLVDGSVQPAAARWWALLQREETLGRLTWIVENTLSSALLERTLELLCTLVTAATAGQQAQQEQLVPQLLALDLLPLVASVLHGWSVRLRAERQAFDGGGGGGAEPVAGSPPGRQAEQGAAQAAEGSAGAAVGEDPEPPLAAPASPAEWDETSVAAAEATEAAALGALALLEALMADPAGEKAVSASVSVKEALLRLVAESEHRGMRALSTALLAELGGVGPMLLQNLAAAAEVLARLGVAAADGDASQGAAKRAKKEAGAAPAAVAPAEQRAAEEVEAAWALVSALAQALRQQADKEAAEGPDATTTGSSAEALAVLEEHLATLCFDWGAVGPSLGRHQAYVLARVAPLLAPRLGESEAAELRAALERVQGGGGAGEGAAGRE